MDCYTFISYQTADKQIAGRIKELLESIGIASFLAHDDIDVSEEWRLKILEEIRKASVFICILSKSYFESSWCVQESGIAAFRADMTIIPLSLDGSIPQGFFSHIQSTKISLENLALPVLFPALIQHDCTGTINEIIRIIGRSKSFRGAEANFKMILPHLDDLTPEQNKDLLERSAENGQIHHAGLCATEYLPPILEKHGHLLNQETRNYLGGICEEYLANKRDKMR
ncbi:toll/interleukin-1 receptor domain-containing protein [Methylococcaceae bacterium WWC4]|nr:toll/interleukin-1 receptor domain-containing protein [Methylococcaceae bacterium WWC4]